MLAFIKIDYYGFKKVSREDYEKLRLDVPNLGMSEWPEKDTDAPTYWKEDTLIDMQTDGMRLSALGVEYSVKKFKGTYIANPTEAVNNHLHVHIPNIGLLMIDEVTWLEDECTEELQRKLDDGWRILAVCPPNSQRRPDYILGRTKSDK